MDAAIAFAQVATRLRYEDLPAPAVKATKNDILDVLGTTLAGSGGAGASELVALAEDLGGKPESSIINWGVKAPSLMAALVNGFMARIVDYDDSYERAVLHTGATVISAALACAERRGGVGGKELIIAVALGIDMICRMGLAKEEGREAGWTGTPLYGYFGSALASSRILGLTEEQTINALGIAYGQATGTMQAVRERVMTKNLEIGCAAHDGVFSALAAQRGITGARNSLEGDMGLFKVFHRGKYDPRLLSDELGKRFEVANLSFKPYPSARPTHAFIDVALALSREHGIRPEEVEEITGYIGLEPHMEFHPLDEKQSPRTVTDAQFSTPYCVAIALVKGAPALDDFTDTAIKNPEVIALARKVVPKLDRSFFRLKSSMPAKLEIKTSRGTYSRSEEHAYGHPENPMSAESLVLKFRDCAAHARRRLPEDSVSRIIEMVQGLEDMKDVAEIVRLFG